MPKPEAGRDLDAAVAVRIMGWQRRTIETNTQQFVVVPQDWTDFSGAHWWGHDIYEQVPHYSTDIAAAWLVVEEMRTDGWDMTLVQTAAMRHEPWDCRLFIAEYKRAIGHGNTAPLAICRAALQAVGAELPH